MKHCGRPLAKLARSALGKREDTSQARALSRHEAKELHDGYTAGKTGGGGRGGYAGLLAANRLGGARHAQGHLVTLGDQLIDRIRLHRRRRAAESRDALSRLDHASSASSVSRGSSERPAAEIERDECTKRCATRAGGAWAVARRNVPTAPPPHASPANLGARRTKRCAPFLRRAVAVVGGGLTPRAVVDR